ncbi:MAG: hypothetical protein P9L89_08650, partial [Candidatus Celaenobacter polaris]|nr:hypothetical protein [Candidatus Celaenobacter polaris]
MKLKIAIIIVLSLLITLPSVVLAEKVEKTGYIKPVDVYAEQINKGAQHNLRGPLYEDFEDLDITGWTIYNGSNPSNNV